MTTMEDTDFRQREQETARYLAQISPLDNNSVCELADKALNDNDPLMRSICFDIIGMLGEQASPALPALVHTLRDGETALRIAAARALRNIAPIAQLCRPALIQALSDTSQKVRIYASEALERLSPQMG
ncbi:MAG: hypothetical protein OEZ43_09815 [Gammaproteobacteria bacterium]|nr:hypothetical protein [Gammaproteobacteria bacterium]